MRESKVSSKDGKQQSTILGWSWVLMLIKGCLSRLWYWCWNWG